MVLKQHGWWSGSGEIGSQQHRRSRHSASVLPEKPQSFLSALGTPTHRGGGGGGGGAWSLGPGSRDPSDSKAPAVGERASDTALPAVDAPPS